MSRRRPTKAEVNRVVTIDLIADWRAYADPLPAPSTERDRRYFGTVTMDGQAGALAWRAGNYGIGIGADVRELGQWDRIKIDSILMGNPHGYADAPRFTPSTGLGVTQFSTQMPPLRKWDGRLPLFSQWEVKWTLRADGIKLPKAW